MGIALLKKWAKSKGEIAERRRNMTRRQPHDRAYDREESDNILTQIYDGMAVYDPEGKKIGTVKRVYLGAVTEAADERGLGRRPRPPQRHLRPRFLRISPRPSLPPNRYRRSCANVCCVVASSESIAPAF